ncbi:MAG: DNA polymerase III subunit beta [Planctomycetota bacterium]|jgi:DNA polymerase-3 subunit beta
MKVICDRAALLDAVNLVTSVAPARSPKHELTCVKLEADDSTLTLQATDADVSLTMQSDRADISEPGSVLIPADKLRQIVAAEDADDSLTIHAKGDSVLITGKDARFTVYSQDASRFPAPPPHKPDPARTLEVNPTDLRRLIHLTLFATARETSRYAFNGVLLKYCAPDPKKSDKRMLELVSTDGRRLARASAIYAGPRPTEDSIACIIPSKALSLVSKLLAQTPDTSFIRLSVVDNQVFFSLIKDTSSDESSNEILLATVTSSLVEGAFPPYDDVIPKQQEMRATFVVETLKSAVRRAALLTTEETRGVRMLFQPDGENSSLRLSSRAPETGEAEIDVEIEDYEGTEIEIGFNPQFILDALKVLDTDKVIFEMKAPNKPGTLRIDNDFIYVVMPVNLQ